MIAIEKGETTRHEFAREIAGYGLEELEAELQRVEQDVTDAQQGLQRAPHDRELSRAYREALALRTELRRAKGAVLSGRSTQIEGAAP